MDISSAHSFLSKSVSKITEEITSLGLETPFSFQDMKPIRSVKLLESCLPSLQECYKAILNSW